MYSGAVIQKQTKFIHLRWCHLRSNKNDVKYGAYRVLPCHTRCTSIDAIQTQKHVQRLLRRINLNVDGHKNGFIAFSLSVKWYIKVLNYKSYRYMHTLKRSYKDDRVESTIMLRATSLLRYYLNRYIYIYICICQTCLFERVQDNNNYTFSSM